MKKYTSKDMTLIGRTKRMLEEGKTPSEIAEIIKCPIDKVNEYVDICRRAEENRKQMTND